MRLMVVYGLKTTDYSWLAGFYPARRMAAECEKRSVELRFLFPRDVPVFLDSRGGEFRNPGETVCLLRGHVDDDTVALLERAGYPCVNSASARAYADDKLATAQFLGRHGWPTPRTWLADSGEGKTAKPPFILKPRFGSRGVGVTLIETAADLAEWDRRERNPKTDDRRGDASGWIAQDYVETSRGVDLRAFFAGGEILACVERRSEDGGIISNASTGGTMSIPRFGSDLPDPWGSMVRDIALESGLWYGTVDFLYNDKIGHSHDSEGKTAARTHARIEDSALNLTICELNSAPGFEALETQCGIDIAGPLIDLLMRDFA